MVNRIINTSINERVTQQVYDTYIQMFDVCTLRHTTHIEAIVQFLPYSALSKSGVMVSTAAVILFFKSGMLTGCVVAQTLCPSRNPKGSSHKGLNRGTVQATDVVINMLSYSFISTRIYNTVHHTCEYNQLQNRSNHFDTPCI